MNNRLEELKELTLKRDYEEIKRVLSKENKSTKGKLFEAYLAFLYKGNGFLATVVGGKNDGGADIIISKPENPSKIIKVVQAKNTNEPINENEVLTEIVKYENKAKKVYPDSYYTIISLSGYTDCLDRFKNIEVAIEDFGYIKQLIDNYSEESKKESILPDLKPHNRWSYKEARELIRVHNKVTIPNATGTGKSYIAAQFIYDYLDKKIMVLAPNIENLRSIKNVTHWASNSTTYMTYSKLSRADVKNNKSKYKFDLIILDEMHRTGANEWGKEVRNLLDINKNSKILALSATPKRFLDNNRNMIDEITDGIHTTPISLFDAIARGILANPTYVAALYDIETELEKKIKKIKNDAFYDVNYNSNLIESNAKKIRADFSNSEFIVNVIKKYAPKNKNGLKFIVFCEDTKHLSEIYPEVIKWLSKVYTLKHRIKHYIVTSEYSNNAKELEEFERKDSKDIKVLFSVNMLNEGLHIKNGVDSVILLRKTISGTIFLQQIGRAFDCSKIIENPVIFDFVNNIDNIETENFSTSINASKSKINNERISLGLETIDIEAKTYIEHPDVLKRINSIEKIATHRWTDFYEVLIEYKEKFNAKPLHNPKKLEPEQKAEIYKKVKSLSDYNIKLETLYKWCETQNTLNIKGCLSEENKEKLKEIGFFNNLVRTPIKRDFDTFKYNLDICKENIIKDISEAINRARKFGEFATHPIYLYQDIYDISCRYINDYFVPKKYFKNINRSKYIIEEKTGYWIKSDDAFYSKYHPAAWLQLEAKKYINNKLEDDKKKYFEEFLKSIDFKDALLEAENTYKRDIKRLVSYMEIVFKKYLDARDSVKNRGIDATELHLNRSRDKNLYIIKDMIKWSSIGEYELNQISIKDIRRIFERCHSELLERKTMVNKYMLLTELKSKADVFFTSREYIRHNPEKYWDSVITYMQENEDNHLFNNYIVEMKEIA